MGGSVVYFDKTSGANYTRGRKRMRGDSNNAPEVKKWNGLMGNIGVSSIDFTNMVSAPSGSVGVYQPARIAWPPAGSTADGYRIGSKITFLGIRFKGWVTLAADQLKQIRWRLLLVRLDLPAGNMNFDAAAYLSQFKNSDSSVPTSWDASRFESWGRHNFYKKFKDVANTSFKTRVIASGVLPPTNEYKKMHIALAGTTGQNQTYLQTRADNVSYVMGVHSGNIGYLPIDIKVKLNDTVDCVQDMRRYYVVLETDCAYGWTDEGVPSATEAGMIINMYSRCYFTDV